MACPTMTTLQHCQSLKARLEVIPIHRTSPARRLCPRASPSRNLPPLFQLLNRSISFLHKVRPSLTPPHEPGSYANTPAMGYVDRIELRDLGDKPLFASECDSPDSASEMSLPQTPSTMGSTTERFSGMGSGTGIDPSPFEGMM